MRTFKVITIIELEEPDTLNRNVPEIIESELNAIYGNLPDGELDALFCTCGGAIYVVGPVEELKDNDTDTD